jgi:hypothetical protein
VSEALLVPPPDVAEMDTVVEVATPAVVTGKVTEVLPEGTVAVDGTMAAEGVPDKSVTTTPAEGAA